MSSKSQALGARGPDRACAVKGWYGDFCFTPPDPIFYAGASGRSWKERIDRSDPPPELVTAGVNSYSHFFFVTYMKLTQSTPRSTPRATLMHILFIIRLKHPPHPVPDRGSAHRRPPWCVTHMFTPGRSHPKTITKTFSADPRCWRPRGPGTRAMAATAATPAAWGSVGPL